MHRLAILLCALTPSLVLLQYGLAKARSGWSNWIIWESFFAGGFASVVVLLPELLLKTVLGIDAMSPVHGSVVGAFMVAGIPEELAKFGAIFYVIKRYGDGSDRQDMIILSLAAALGFATIENVAYLGAFGDLRHLGLSRALLAAPVHALTGLTMGAFLTGAQLHPRNHVVWVSAALIVPMAIHGSYDFPILLVGRASAFYGVLPAWFLFLMLLSTPVLLFSNKMRASARARAVVVPTNGAGLWNPRIIGVALILLVPVLAILSLFQDGRFGLVGAAGLSILPAIFGIDLLFTTPPAVPFQDPDVASA